MPKYPCLVLDHDDTVVQSEKTLAYPFFCQTLAQCRPDATISFHEYVHGCHDYGFANMCRYKFQFTEQELEEEHAAWLEYIKSHIPDPYPGIEKIIHRQKQAGGLVCVVSHSSKQNITRDYSVHFGIQPDAIYGRDLPEHLCKPSTYPLEQIMKHYDLQPKDILVVDDMKLAWQMAHPLKVEVAFAGWGKLEFPELSKEMQTLCDYSFYSTKELENFLFG